MTELPKQQLLIKLMGMTGSANDGEALVALRKATALLTSAGWTWERLIEGKIKVVENPFKSDNPFANRERVVRQQGPAPQPQSAPQWANPAQPKPVGPIFHTASPTNPLNTIKNKFAGFCYCCGKDTPAGAGFIFDPWGYVPAAKSKWEVACTPCNTSGTVYSTPAAPIRNKKKAAITDLA